MKAFLAALFFGAIGVFLIWLMGPSIWQDFRTDESKLVPALEYTVTEARCKSRVFVVTSCDVELTNSATKEEVDFDYFMFGRLGGERVYGLKSEDGQTLTTNIGMDYATNRLITLVIFGLFCLAMVAGGILAMFKQNNDQDLKA